MTLSEQQLTNSASRASVTYFLSDMHITEQRPDITAALLNFLAGPGAQADAIYLLGDVFDYWIGDDYITEPAQQLKQSLNKLHHSGVKLYFVAGNRDFLINRRFAKETGCKLLAAHTVIDLYGQPVLIMHGDTLCTLDVNYQNFRKKSRTWWWQLLMRNLPLTTRLNYVKKLKARSKSEKSMKSEQIMDVTQEEVEHQMRLHQVQYLIHGHTHRQAIHRFELDHKPAQRIVLGDWYQAGSVLKWTPENEPEYLTLPL